VILGLAAAAVLVMGNRGTTTLPTNKSPKPKIMPNPTKKSSAHHSTCRA
jgi:hypothetical protein